MSDSPLGDLGDDADGLWDLVEGEEVDLVTLPTVDLTVGIHGPYRDCGDIWPGGTHSCYGSLTGGRSSHEPMEHQVIADIERRLGTKRH